MYFNPALPIGWGTGRELPGSRLDPIYASNQFGSDTTDPTVAAAMQASSLRVNQSAPQVDPDQRMQAAAELQQRNNPLVNGMDDRAILAAQLARDPTGEVRRLLGAMQGANPTAHPISVAEQQALPQQQKLKAYHPEGDFFGGMPSEDSMTSTLDTVLVSHPEFAKMYQKDPRKASIVYKSLKGRDLETDLKAHRNIQIARDKFDVQETQKMIHDGAKFDDITGKLMLWQMTEPPPSDPNSFQLPGARQPQATRTYREASPDQTEIFKRGYQRVTGKPLDAQNTKGEYVSGPKAGAIEAARMEGFSRNNSLIDNPAIKTLIANKERELGRKMNSHEIVDWTQRSMSANPRLVDSDVGGPFQKLLAPSGNPDIQMKDDFYRRMLKLGVADPQDSIEEAVSAVLGNRNSWIPPRRPQGSDLRQFDQYP